VGTPWPVETLVELLLRDLPYYRHSGGGVTLSGGECTLYPNYLAALLQRLKDAGVHVTLETCGQFEYESFEQNVLPGLDLIYYDIKCAASDDHQRLTGRRNDRILENLRRLIARKQPPVVVRTPLVPGLTATPENLSALVDILSRIGVRELTLLPYNPMGLEMYEKLGRPQPNLPQRFMTAEEENEVRKVFERLLLRSRPRFDSSVHEELDHLFLTAQGEGRA
jgi:pyruvate formate lyase activating enzyme